MASSTSMTLEERGCGERGEEREGEGEGGRGGSDY